MSPTRTSRLRPDAASARRSTAGTTWVVEPWAVGALLYREWRVFRRVWRSSAFGSLVEPVTYFVAFGYGYGAVLARMGGLSYREFIATGTVAIGVLFSSIFPAFINGYVRRRIQHLYDGLLSAPVSIAELVTGESVWNALRVAAVAAITTVVAVLFDVTFGPGVVLAPVLAVIAGFGFSALGLALSSRLTSAHQFDFVIVGVIVPMFISAGTFFPIENLPPALAVLAQANPLYHLLEALRAVVFATPDLMAAVPHVVVLVAFDLAAWVIAVRLLRDALVD